MPTRNLLRENRRGKSASHRSRAAGRPATSVGRKVRAVEIPQQNRHRQHGQSAQHQGEIPDLPLVPGGFASAGGSAFTGHRRNVGQGIRSGKSLRAGRNIRRGAVFTAKVGWQGATRANTLHESATEEQGSQTAFARENPTSGGSLAFELRGRGRHSPLRGCSTRSASPQAKNPRRNTAPNIQTGSQPSHRVKSGASTSAGR